MEAGTAVFGPPAGGWQSSGALVVGSCCRQADPAAAHVLGRPPRS